MADKLLSKKEPRVEAYELLDSDEKKDSDVITNGSPPYQVPPRGAKEQSEFFDLLFDIVLIGVPVLLLAKIALCIYCFYQDRTHTGLMLDQASSLTKVMIEFNGQLVTLFTILFVSIMATLMRRYALYKAQKGAYLVQLEQLQSSISLPSTFKMIWKLRAWTMMSVVLVIMWAFYYIGSQASKREFSLEDSDTATEIRALTINFDAPTDLLPKRSDNATELAAINDVFSTGINPVFSGAAKESLDDWKTYLKEIEASTVRGSLLGPLVPNLQFATRPVDDLLNSRYDGTYYSGIFPLTEEKLKPLKKNLNSEYYDVSVQSRNMYTSFVGRQLLLQYPDFSNTGTTYSTTAAVIGKYDFETGYFNVQCDTPQVLPWSAFPNGTWANSTVSMNMTTVTASTPRDNRNNTLQQFDFWYRSFWQGSTNCVDNIVLRSTCNITTTYVDVNVRCKAQGCVPNKMQYRDGDSEAGATSWVTPFLNSQFASIFFRNIINSTGTPAISYGGYGNTPFARYIGVDAYDDALNLFVTPAGNNSKNCTFNSEAWQTTLPSIARATSYRLSILFTSYYEVIQMYQSKEGTWMRPAYALGGHNATIMDKVKVYYTPLTFKGNFYQPGYYLFWPWIALDIVSCLILFVAGILCYILRQKTLAPDIFGYVSTLTRDNPNLNLPDIGSTYTGIERANLFKNVKIKIGDVHGQNHPQASSELYGKIGVVRADVENQWVEELHPQRKYV